GSPAGMDTVLRAFLVAANQRGLSTLASVDKDRLFCGLALVFLFPKSSASRAGHDRGILLVVGRVIGELEQTGPEVDLLLDVRQYLLFEARSIRTRVVLHIGEQRRIGAGPLRAGGTRSSVFDKLRVVQRPRHVA